jgi:hypothetical protein
MTHPSATPLHVPDNSQVQLRALYDANGFAELLPKCERIAIVTRRRRKPEDTFHADLAEYEEGAKFRDPVTLHTLAVIFWYTDAEGRTFETIRSLRIGDTVYDARPHRD